MKRAGLLSYATVVALIALGSIAAAAPSFRGALYAAPASAETGATGSSGPGEGTGPTAGSGPIETLVPEEEEEDGGDSPDLTACGGLSGLDNAICRHEALLVVHTDNQGLQNSLARLQENRAAHEARQRSKTADSEDPSGKGKGNANGHGKDGAGEG